MKIVDKGVLQGSTMDFSMPSEFAQQTLFFCLDFGHFVCDKNYHIERNYLNQFLLFYVGNGSLHLRCGNEYVLLTENHIGLLDCREPHSYWCEDHADFYWFHFNGNSSSYYVDYLRQRFGLSHSGSHVRPLKDDFLILTKSVRTSKVNEHHISLCIHRIMSTLASPKEYSAAMNKLLTPAIDYIHNHFSENISLDTLAACCSISKSHLIRSFKQYTNNSPHEYVVQYRLRQAKRLLVSTGLTIEQIAEECGFNSASHFTRSFRHSNNLTPTEFRNIGF